MVMETIQKVIATLGASDIDERLEVRLVDGIIYSFQEQTTEDQVMLDGFGTVVNALGIRVRPYLMQIVSVVLFRLNNKSAKVRQQAADLTTRLAVVIKQCGENQLLYKLGVVLFEQLGEEYPDTLGRYVQYFHILDYRYSLRIVLSLLLVLLQMLWVCQKCSPL